MVIPREKDPLVIRDIQFIGPMATVDGWRPDTALPEVAFAGRSNVGKSSLLNTLVRRKKFARVSNTPGRTRQINFFRVNDQFVLADLPGYGYARVSKERRAEWKPLIENYLTTSHNLHGIVLLFDVRHDPTNHDLQMLDFLAELEIPTIVVLTKIDKLTTGQLSRRVPEIARQIGAESGHVILFSAVTGIGRDELGEALVALLAEPSWRRS